MGGSIGGPRRRARSPCRREELDHVAAPAVVALGELHADDPLRLERLGLGLHALHRQLARVVERLGEVRQLDVLARLLHRLEHAAVRDVVDAGAHDHADRAVAGAQQRPEVLAGEVARERAAVGRAVQLAAAVLDRGADGDELRHVLAPLVAADVQPHADDAVGAELVGLLLHARHRQLAGGVHRLGEHVHLLARPSSWTAGSRCGRSTSRRPARAGRSRPP